MKKLDGKTLDLVGGNIAEIKRLFPSCIREGKVDFDALKALLDKEGVVSDDKKEQYSFTWWGKQQAKRIALQQNAGTLLPVRDESVNFDSTQNMIIEGDNLEALRLLLKSYSGKIKMIYIDPPYNTGNDFVYKDDFSDNLKNYVEKSGQALESNQETNGRFHSDWLSMIYPRLALARNLLTEDGVIFISIDDNEINDLRIMMNEIFGEENFVENFIVRSNPRGNQAKKYTASEHEYVICYARDKTNISPLGFSKEESEFDKKDENGEIYREIGLRKRGAGARREDAPNQYFAIYYNPDTKDISLEKTGKNDVEILPKLSDGHDGRWRWSKKTVMEDKKKLVVRLVRRNESQEYDIFEKDFFSEGKSSKIKSIFYEKEFNYENATEELKELFDGVKIFDYPKPVFTIKHLVECIIDSESLILDFFAGSGTTAHAVLQQNAEDNGNRKFILVQLPEQTDKDSEAFKAGYKTISEITKERVRRVIKKIKEERKQQKLEKDDLDLGFKVFKLDSTNIIPWDPNPKNLQATLEKSVSNIKEGRKDEDILYEILLKYGVDLTSEIKAEKIDNKTIYNVGNGYLYVCLDKNLSKNVIQFLVDDIKVSLTTDKARVVFGDQCFKEDQDAVNAELLLKKAGVQDIRRL